METAEVGQYRLIEWKEKDVAVTNGNKYSRSWKEVIGKQVGGHRPPKIFLARRNHDNTQLYLIISAVWSTAPSWKWKMCMNQIKSKNIFVDPNHKLHIVSLRFDKL